MHTLTPTAEPRHRRRRCRARCSPRTASASPTRDLDPWVADIDAEALRGLYRDMVLVRRIDTEGVALQRQGQLGLWAPCQGQEATQIGTARAFRADDFVFPSYREIGVSFVRGAAPRDFVLAWRGEEHSTYNPYDINTATPQIIIGAQTLHAVGYAMGIQRDGTDQVAVAYFGDGATSQGDVNEAMVFASSFKAPVVFVCTNNQWAISEPVTRAGEVSRSPAARRASASRACVSTATTCSPALAAMRWALDHARTGKGPAFIEAVTYRMGPHTTSDDPTRYRDKDEVERWRGATRCTRLEALLRAQGEFDDEFAARGRRPTPMRWRREVRAACLGAVTREPLDGLRQRLRRAARRARRAARATSPPTSTDSRMPRPTRGRDDDASSRWARPSTRACAARWPTTRRCSSWARTSASSAACSASPTGCSTSSAPRASSTPRWPSPGIMGTAVGLAFRGYRPVVEIQFDGFVYPAFDQIVCQVAKLHYRTHGQRDDADHDPHPVGRRRRAPPSTTPSRPRRTSCTRRACASSRSRTRRTPTSCCARRSPPTTRWCSSSRSGCTTTRARSTSTPISPTRRRWVSRASRARARDVTLLTYGAQVVDGAGCRDRRRGRGHLDRGHRPALALARGLPHGRGIRPQDRPGRRDPRGGARGGRRRRAHRQRHRALLPLPGGAAGARHRARHPVPAREAREAPPARPRPDPRRASTRAGPAEQPRPGAEVRPAMRAR